MSLPKTVRMSPSIWTYGAALVGLPLSVLFVVALVLFMLALYDVGPGEVVGGSPSSAGKLQTLGVLFVIMGLHGAFGLRAACLGVFVRYSHGWIDEQNHQVVLRPFIGKSRMIPFDALRGYSACSMPSWIPRSSPGIALYMKDGKHIQLSETSIASLAPLYAALDRASVVCFGEEHCWFYPFTKRRYKFDPK